MADGEEGISIPDVPKPMPAVSERELPEAPEPGEARPAPEKRVSMSEHTRPNSPPLFIKIDKYQEVVDNVQKLKSFALSLRDALDALADIQKELTTGVNIAHKALDDFNTTISMIDSKLTRVGETGTGKSLESQREMGGYVRNLYSQMDKIKQELKNVSDELE